VSPEGECLVVLVSHEEARIWREWASVAEFLEEMLAGEDEE
jgi:hypothetical protein